MSTTPVGACSNALRKRSCASASCARSSARLASSRLRSLMSRMMADTPITVPVAPRMGETDRAIGTAEPSRHTRVPSYCAASPYWSTRPVKASCQRTSEAGTMSLIGRPIISSAL